MGNYLFSVCVRVHHGCVTFGFCLPVFCEGFTLLMWNYMHAAPRLIYDREFEDSDRDMIK